MSQLNFFLFTDEVLLKLNALIKTGEVDIFQGRFFKNEIPDPVDEINETTNIYNLIFWFKNDVKYPRGYMVKTGKYQGLFLFDYYKDPIIEFSDCIRTAELILPGRIYYKAGWIENPDLRKNHEKWAKRVSRLFDKDMKKVKDFWRVSNSVINWINDQGKLELVKGGFPVNKENLNSLIKW